LKLDGEAARILLDSCVTLGAHSGGSTGLASAPEIDDDGSARHASRRSRRVRGDGVHLGIVRDAARRRGDAEWMATWTLLANGQVIFQLPRIAVIRNSVLNHSIHHRAQLGFICG
jgi:hypothetical protein